MGLPTHADRKKDGTLFTGRETRATARRGTRLT
jgi:hypothetical protein